MPLLHRWGGRAWSLALTLSAVIGTLCFVGTLAAPLLGIRPLIFTSGSMAPAIPTGSLAFARDVPAEDLKVGDVVTVPLHGSFVTHRIVGVTQGVGTATLVLRGDGNEVSDADAYVVSSAPRTFFSVPRLGTFVAWFSRAPGVYVLAAWVALVLSTMRRGAPRTQKAPAPRPRAALGRPQLATVTRAFRVPRRRGLVPVHAFIGVVLAAPWVAPTATLASDVESPTSAAAAETTVETAPAPRVPLLWCDRADRRGTTVRWTPVEDATGYRLILGDGGRKVHVAADTTSRTFLDRASGVLSVKAISATGLWISEVSNAVRYDAAGAGSCR